MAFNLLNVTSDFMVVLKISPNLVYVCIESGRALEEL